MAGSRSGVSGHQLGDDELVGRFIYSRSHFSSAKQYAKPGAFSPAPHAMLSTAQ